MDRINQTVAVVPAYKPDERIFTVLNDLYGLGFASVTVVDDGNTEAYAPVFAEIARRFPQCTVLHHCINLGKGRAIRTAFADTLTRFPGMACVTVDCDGQHDPGDAATAARLCGRYENALIIGCRDLAHGKYVPAASRFGNAVSRLTVRFLTGLPYSDTQTGLRGYPPKVMKALMSVNGDRFEFENNTLLVTRELGLDVAEYPIKTIYLPEGRYSTTFRRVTDSVNVYKNLLAYHTAPGISFLLCMLAWLLCASRTDAVAAGILFAALGCVCFLLTSVNTPFRCRFLTGGVPFALLGGLAAGLLLRAGLTPGASLLCLMLPYWLVLTLFYRVLGRTKGKARFIKLKTGD